MHTLSLRLQIMYKIYHIVGSKRESQNVGFDIRFCYVLDWYERCEIILTFNIHKRQTQRFQRHKKNKTEEKMCNEPFSTIIPTKLVYINTIKRNNNIYVAHCVRWYFVFARFYDQTIFFANTNAENSVWPFLCLFPWAKRTKKKKNQTK